MKAFRKVEFHGLNESWNLVGDSSSNIFPVYRIIRTDT